MAKDKLKKPKDLPAYAKADWTRLVDEQDRTLGFDGKFTDCNGQYNIEHMRSHAWKTANYFKNTVTRDENGYSVFRTPEDYSNCQILRIRRHQVEGKKGKTEWHGDSIKGFEKAVRKHIDVDDLPVEKISSKPAPFIAKMEEYVSEPSPSLPSYSPISEAEAYALVTQKLGWNSPDSHIQYGGFSAHIDNPNIAFQAAWYLKEKGLIDQRQYDYINDSVRSALSEPEEPFFIVIAVKEDPAIALAESSTWVEKTGGSKAGTNKAAGEIEKKARKKKGGQDSNTKSLFD